MTLGILIAMQPTTQATDVIRISFPAPPAAVTGFRKLRGSGKKQIGISHVKSS
jgi:hypothetical protein